MSAHPPTHAPDESLASLRAALFAPPAPATGTPTPAPAGAVAPQAASLAGIVPTATELLAASPNLQRLCESYHTSRRKLIERGRRQRLGIAALVCGLAVGATFLAHQGSLPANLVNLLVISVAAASVAGLAVLSFLWVRDERRLRNAQGDRLLRALQFNCSLPQESLSAFRRMVHPTTAFFDCYDAWRVENPERRSALQILVGAFSGKSQRAASA